MKVAIVVLTALYAWILFCCNLFICICRALFAIIVPVTLWRIDSAPALKCNDYQLESWLAGHLKKGSVHWRERPSM